MSITFPDIQDVEEAIHTYIKEHVKNQKDALAFFTLYLYFKVVDGLLNDSEIELNNTVNIKAKAELILNNKEDVENANISSYLNILNNSAQYKNTDFKAKLQEKLTYFNNNLDHYIECIQHLKQLFTSQEQNAQESQSV